MYVKIIFFNIYIYMNTFLICAVYLFSLSMLKYFIMINFFFLVLNLFLEPCIWLLEPHVKTGTTSVVTVHDANLTNAAPVSRTTTWDDFKKKINIQTPLVCVHHYRYYKVVYRMGLFDRRVPADVVIVPSRRRYSIRGPRNEKI